MSNPKTVPVSNAESASVVIPTMRILKVAACPSLSGKSTLTYHIGFDQDAALHIRIFRNSGSGYFNVEWVPIDKLKSVMSGNQLITFYTLHFVFKGKSQNNGGFMLAALLAEGLIEVSSINERCYQEAAGVAFYEQIAKLIAEGIDLDPNTKPKIPRKKLIEPEPQPSETL